MSYLCLKCENKKATFVKVGIHQVGINIKTDICLFARTGVDLLYCDDCKPKYKHPYLIPIEDFRPYCKSNLLDLKEIVDANI